jgi:hypothetical protein
MNVLLSVRAHIQGPSEQARSQGDPGAVVTTQGTRGTLVTCTPEDLPQLMGLGLVASLMLSQCQQGGFAQKERALPLGTWSRPLTVCDNSLAVSAGLLKHTLSHPGMILGLPVAWEAGASDSVPKLRDAGENVHGV